MIGTEYGIFATDNGGDDWVMANQNMASAPDQPTAPVFDLKQQWRGAAPWVNPSNQGAIYAATHGRGIFRSDLFLDVEDLDEDVAAQAQGLLVYPNPVSDANFTIQSSAMKGDFQLQVFDLTGRLAVDRSVTGYVGGPLVVDASTAQWPVHCTLGQWPVQETAKLWFATITKNELKNPGRKAGDFFALVMQRESEVKQGRGSVNNFPAGEMLIQSPRLMYRAGSAEEAPAGRGTSRSNGRWRWPKMKQSMSWVFRMFLLYDQSHSFSGAWNWRLLCLPWHGCPWKEIRQRDAKVRMHPAESPLERGK